MHHKEFILHKYFWFWLFSFRIVVVCYLLKWFDRSENEGGFILNLRYLKNLWIDFHGITNMIQKVMVEVYSIKPLSLTLAPKNTTSLIWASLHPWYQNNYIVTMNYHNMHIRSISASEIANVTCKQLFFCMMFGCTFSLCHVVHLKSHLCLCSRFGFLFQFF